MPDHHDWEADPRPFAEVVMDWAARRNGGSVYGARKVAAAELRIESEATLAGYLNGRPCKQERTYRRLMTLIDAV